MPTRIPGENPVISKREKERERNAEKRELGERERGDLGTSET